MGTVWACSSRGSKPGPLSGYEQQLVDSWDLPFYRGGCWRCQSGEVTCPGLRDRAKVTPKPDFFLIITIACLATKLRGNLSSGFLHRMWFSPTHPVWSVLSHLSVRCGCQLWPVPHVHGWEFCLVWVCTTQVGLGLAVLSCWSWIWSSGFLIPKRCDFSRMPPAQFYVVVGIEPRALCMLSIQDGATSLVPLPCIFIFNFPPLDKLAFFSPVVKCTLCKTHHFSYIMSVGSAEVRSHWCIARPASSSVTSFCICPN